MADKMLWNKEQTECVKASKIRNISLYPNRVDLAGQAYTEVRGWYNENENFYFGRFATDQEARFFINDLNARIEGGN